MDLMILIANQTQTPGQVLVSVRAIGMNFADVYGVLGLYSSAGQPPYTPGFEICGVIHAIAEDVTEFKVGDKVFGLTKFGAYTTAISIHQDYIRHLPSDWSFEQGAAWSAQAITAWYALSVLGGISKNNSRVLTSPAKRVLVHSAAGGVGLLLVELIRHMGGEIIATVGHPDKIEILRQRGVAPERIIVRNVDDADDGFEETVRKRIGDGNGGVDVVIDSVMGPYFNPGWNLLNRGGRYIVMGAASLMPSTSLSLGNIGTIFRLMWGYLRRPKLDLVGTINENKTVSGFNIGMLFDCKDLLKNGFSDLFEMDLPAPFVSRTFAFDDAKDALREFQKGRSVGKLVITCPPDTENN